MNIDSNIDENIVASSDEVADSTSIPFQACRRTHASQETCEKCEIPMSMFGLSALGYCRNMAGSVEAPYVDIKGSF